VPISPGATPSVIPRTARAQRAKHLLDETEVSMVDLAMQAGFGSLRRFDAAFAKVRYRPPSEIRRRPRSH
jgi:AraC family transcriptional regulator, regulatory protein of adaptative response / methylated-DNA-[protein]-cysteine methyltransferase